MEALHVHVPGHDGLHVENVRHVHPGGKVQPCGRVLQHAADYRDIAPGSDDLPVLGLDNIGNHSDACVACTHVLQQHDPVFERRGVLLSLQVLLPLFFHAPDRGGLPVLLQQRPSGLLGGHFVLYDK